jgi:sn-glycerol 3-phosphate transport system permease protein
MRHPSFQRNRPTLVERLSHLIVLVLGVLVVAFPVYLTFVAARRPPSRSCRRRCRCCRATTSWTSYRLALFWAARRQVRQLQAPVAPHDGGQPGQRAGHRHRQDRHLAAVGFAIVYFRFPVRMLVFWMIFVTLMLPVEVRIGPTYEVVSDLGMLNSYAGLTMPLIASATATFLFRQFFLTVPDELVEAARIDGAGPMRFFKDVLLPLSARRSRRCSSSSSSTAGTSTCGRCW